MIIPAGTEMQQDKKDKFEIIRTYREVIWVNGDGRVFFRLKTFARRSLYPLEVDLFFVFFLVDHFFYD